MKKTIGSLRIPEPKAQVKKKTQAQLNLKHENSVHRFPSSKTKFGSYTAAELISWIDEKYKFDRLADLDVTPELAASLLKRFPPSVSTFENSICLDGDVIKTYSLLKRLTDDHEVTVVHIPPNDPLAGLCINSSELFAAYSRKSQIAELLTLCEINESLKSTDRSKPVTSRKLARFMRITPAQVSRLLRAAK